MSIVRDWMFSDIATLDPAATLLEAARRMVRQGQGFIVVLDQMQLVGLVTGYDLTRWMAQEKDLERLTLADMRLSAPMAVYEETPVRELMRIYNQRKFRRFPVLNSEEMLSGGIMEKQIIASLPRSNLLAHYRVADVMVPDPPTISRGSSFMETVRLMVDGHRGCVLVLENGRLAGMITERDLLKCRVGENWTPDKAVDDPACFDAPESISPDKSLLDALTFFQETEHRRVPVVDDSGRPLGLITQTGLLKRIAESVRSHEAVLNPEDIAEPALWFEPHGDFQILAMNHGGGDLLAVDADAIVGRSVTTFFPDPSLWEALATLLGHCGRLGPIQLSLRTGAGDWLCAACRFRLVHTPSGDDRIFMSIVEADETGESCAAPGSR